MFALCNWSASILQVKDCLDHTVLPMDGATLAEAMHQRGINMRYLGKVINFITKTPGRAQLDHIFVSVRFNFRLTIKTASGIICSV